MRHKIQGQVKLPCTRRTPNERFVTLKYRQLSREFDRHEKRVSISSHANGQKDQLEPTLETLSMAVAAADSLQARKVRRPLAPDALAKRRLPRYKVNKTRPSVLQT